MKQLIFTLAVGIISLSGMTSDALGQKLNLSAVLTPKEEITLERSTPAIIENTNELSGINTKAIKDFSKSHKNVNNATWLTNQEGFTATFKVNDVYNVVYYNKKGRWMGNLKGYTEDKMAADLRKMIKRVYYDYVITYVHEAEMAESKHEPTYIIHMQDDKTLMLLRIYDGEMEVWEQYKRGN
ncbi:hypothetical protein BH11BAC3_BH11BAC3_32960 [soil metagenome]